MDPRAYFVALTQDLFGGKPEEPVTIWLRTGNRYFGYLTGVGDTFLPGLYVTVLEPKDVKRVFLPLSGIVSIEVRDPESKPFEPWMTMESERKAGRG